jgi:hypothetical protein
MWMLQVYPKCMELVEENQISSVPQDKYLFGKDSDSKLAAKRTGDLFPPSSHYSFDAAERLRHRSLFPVRVALAEIRAKRRLTRHPAPRRPTTIISLTTDLRGVVAMQQTLPGFCPAALSRRT